MWSSYRRLLRHLGPHAGVLVLAFVLLLLAAGLDAFSLVLLIPFLQSLFGDAGALAGGPANLLERFLEWSVGDLVRGATPLESLRNVCLVVLVAVLLKNLTGYGARACSIIVRERVERDLRDTVYAHVQRLPLSFFGRVKVGQLIARILNDTREARDVISQGLTDIVRKGMTAIGYLVALLLISWPLTLVALVAAPLLGLLLAPLMRRLRRGYRVAFDHQGELLSVLQETISGIRLVKAFGAERHERGRFQERSAAYTRRMVRTATLAAAAGPVSEVLSSITALALIWIGASMVLGTGAMGAATFLTFITIAMRLISPVKALAQFPPKLQLSLAAADRFFEVLDAVPEPPPRPGDRDVRSLEREIRFENVWFEYEPGTPVLREIDIKVARGQVVALVGPSGAGKSTLVDLLPRFIDPTRGCVRLDGVDLRQLSLRSLRSLFGIVSQETVVFHDTVRANIAYGDRRSQAEVEEAARAAHAYRFISELPDGFDTMLGERGVRLSGGQLQRIGIARALLRDPPILILDEATSSLDTEAEQLIQRALTRLLRGRTVFVIAHRLSTVHGADHILVLDRGEIVEQGTHGELYAGGGLYRRLHDLQFATPEGAVGA